MYEITLVNVVLNLMSLSERLLIFFDKVLGLNSWTMKDKFTFRVCRSKFIYTGKDFEAKAKQEFPPKGEGRSGRRPLLPKRNLNTLVDLTLGKSYHSVVTFLHAQKIKCYTFSIQTSLKLISCYVCPWKVGP